MNLPNRDWTEMTWREIAGAGAAAARWIAVLPLAAVEQHGPHLPLGVDSFIAEAYLARVRDILPEELPVTFLPVQSIGVSVEHLAFPGTLTVSAATAIATWTEIGESLAACRIAQARAGHQPRRQCRRHGIGGARSARPARDMLAVTVGWHRFGYPEGTFSREEKRHGIHGGDIETSLMLAARPETVRAGADAKRDAGHRRRWPREFKWLGAFRPAGFAWMTQDLNHTGAIGDATLATADKGEAALDAWRASLRGTLARD